MSKKWTTVNYFQKTHVEIHGQTASSKIWIEIAQSATERFLTNPYSSLIWHSTSNFILIDKTIFLYSDPQNRLRLFCNNDVTVCLSSWIELVYKLFLLHHKESSQGTDCSSYWSYIFGHKLLCSNYIRHTNVLLTKNGCVYDMDKW